MSTEPNHNIAFVRQALELSSGEFATKTGFTIHKLTKWETGRSSPTLDELHQVAEALSIPVVALVRGKHDMRASLRRLLLDNVRLTMKNAELEQQLQVAQARLAALVQRRPKAT